MDSLTTITSLEYRKPLLATNQDFRSIRLLGNPTQPCFWASDEHWFPVNCQICVSTLAITSYLGLMQLFSDFVGRIVVDVPTYCVV